MIFHFHVQIFEILGNLVTGFYILNNLSCIRTQIFVSYQLKQMFVNGYEYSRSYTTSCLKFQHTKTALKRVIAIPIH